MKKLLPILMICMSASYGHPSLPPIYCPEMVSCRSETCVTYLGEKYFSNRSGGGGSGIFAGKQLHLCWAQAPNRYLGRGSCYYCIESSDLIIFLWSKKVLVADLDQPNHKWVRISNETLRCEGHNHNDCPYKKVLGPRR